MIARLIVLLALVAQVFAGLSNTKITAAVKDTSINGIEGFNVEIDAPFKWQDYVVGFRYAVGDLKRAPQNLFAKRTFDVAGDSKATLRTEFNLDTKTLSVDADLSNDHHGFQIQVNGDSKNKLKAVAIEKKLDVEENKVTVSAAYDLLKKKLFGNAKVETDATTVNVAFNSEDKDPVLSVTRAIDDNNEVSPSISLKTGDVSYGYKRKWTGGSVAGRLFPGEKVAVEWRDQGAQGEWVTTADIPLDNAFNAKVTFAREWNY